MEGNVTEITPKLLLSKIRVSTFFKFLDQLGRQASTIYNRSKSLSLVCFCFSLPSVLWFNERIGGVASILSTHGFSRSNSEKNKENIQNALLHASFKWHDFSKDALKRNDARCMFNVLTDTQEVQLKRLFQYCIYELERIISGAKKGFHSEEERVIFQSALITLLFLTLGGQRREFIVNITLLVSLFVS